MAPMSVRPVEPGDSELIWRWRNDPVVRQHSLTSAPVSWSDHAAWFARTTASPDVVIYVLDEPGVGPVAQVRYTRESESRAEVHVSVAPQMRGRGHGKSLLLQTAPLACAKLDVSEIEAHVVKSNPASVQLFLSTGYEPAGEVVKGGRECLRFLWKRSKAETA